MINTFNCAKIEGREFTKSEKNELSEQIVARIDLRQDIVMEPSKAYRAPFYVYSSKDNLNCFHTFNGYKPKTMLFYSNYCELELQTKLYFVQTLYEMNTEESRKYLLMLAQCIQHLGNRVERGNSNYRTINGKIIENCVAQVGE